jgi:AcrR family transcriptional regulator
MFNEDEVIPLETGDPQVLSRRAKRADAVANRELILATARRLFKEQGVAKVCMATIAEAAGVGKGTLYRAFANKGELCLALMDKDMRAFQNKILQWFKANYDQPALVKLDFFLDELVHFLDFHAPLLREVQAHGTFKSGETGSPHTWVPWLQDTIGFLLQQAQQKGETGGLDIPYLVDAILAPLNAELFIYQREVLGFSLERISRGLRQLALKGCCEPCPKVSWR